MLDATLQELGWDDRWASELEQLDEDKLVAGRIAAQHRGEYVLWTATGELRAELPGRIRYDAAVTGVLPAVGDWVAARARALEGRATICNVLPRRTSIVRKEALGGSHAQVLAANVDTAFLLNGLDSDFSVRRLERYLVLAWESGAEPVIVLTKTDLCPDLADKVLEVEAVAIGVPVYPVSNVTGQGVDAVQGRLRPATSSVVLGSSGVGKSTLINRIAGEEVMRTSALAADGTGRHTTTHRELIRLPGGALVIDTPGLRELQLWEGDSAAAFSDIEALAADCRFADCAHVHEPDCAVLGAVDDGTLELDRLRAWRKLERELAAVAARTDRRLNAERKRRWKQHARSIRRAKW
ncbi:MAG: ribosome small subunit-dependent GTPase A [Actinobacteria bacterium]|nr:MAG: ribosome small subunit-dependent GTPase A [Actinomycetota bacterium]